MMQKLTKLTTRALATLFAVFATTSAWATVPVPTVVWDGDFEDNVGKTGSDGNTYTFKLDDTGNSVDNGVLVISSSASKGATIVLGDENKTKISILIKYSNLSAPGGTSTTNCLASISLNSDANFPLLRNENSSSLAAGLGYAGTAAAARQFRGVTQNFATTAGCALFSYNSDSGTRAYVGANIASLAGGENTTIKWGSAKPTKISLGGPYKQNTNSGTTVWPNVRIEKVAIFVNEYYSNTDVSEYKWPSEVKAELSTWFDDDRTVYAWRGGSAAFHSAKFGAVAAGGTIAAGNSVDYNLFGVSRIAPGYVLYYDATGYIASSAANFTPVALGGLCVKSKADNSTNYSIGGTSDTAYRKTYLGYAGYVTYWTFDESFSFNRNDDSVIYGTANVTVAAGKTFDLNSSQTSYVCSLDNGATLKVSGEGSMAVAKLNASNGTLDFTGLSGRSAALPFINGTIQLGANTAIVLPAGTTSPYKIGSAVTGSATSLTIGTKTYATTVSAGENAGEIEWEVNEATITEAGDSYDIATVFGAALVNTKDYSLKVEQDATLNVGTSAARAITIEVDEGKTLTLSGTSLTATTINITGKGVVKVTAGGALKGTVTGDGTLLYTKSTSEATNVIPTIGSAGISLAPSWNGTLWLKDITGSSYNSGAGGNRVSTGLTDMANYGVSGSKVKFTNVHAWCNNISVPWTLVLEDGESEDEVAWENDNGSTGNKTVGITIAALEGDGTFCDNYDSCYPYLKFTSVENFRGSIVSKGKRILLGNATIGSVGAGSRGSFTVGSDITATIATGKKWSSGGVFTINGNITNNGTIETTGTGTESNAGKARPDNDSNNYSQVPNVVVSGVLTNAGTITIPNVASVSVSGTANYAASVSGATTVSGGTLNVNAETGGAVTISSGTANYAASVSGATIVNGGTLNVMANTSGAITVNNGGVVNTSGTISLSGANVVNVGGTLNVENGNATLTTDNRGISGTVNIGDGATLTANTGDSMNYNSDGSGTINVYGTLAMGTTRWTMGPGNTIRVFTDGVVNGTAEKSLHFNTGSANIRASKVGEEATGVATINCPVYLESGTGGTVTVDDGMTLVLTANAFAGSDNKRMTKAGTGCLKFQRSGSGTTYVPTVSEGTVEIADNWIYSFGAIRDFTGFTVAAGSSPTLKVQEERSEIGFAGGVAISNIDSSITAITVAEVDGSSQVLTPSDGAIIAAGDPVVGTSACWHDWEFEGNVNDAVSSDPKNLATSWGETSGIYSYEDGESGNQVMKLTQRGGLDGQLTYPETWSAAIRCKVPTNYKGWVIAFGNQGSGAIGLAAGETDGTVMLVDSINSTTYRNIADMSIASPTTAFHVYVFVKTPNDVTTYCDGVLVNREVMEKTIPGSFQIGTMITGKGALEMASNGQIDYLRLYDYALSDAQIAKLTSDNPYISTTPVFTRDMAGDPWWYTGAATWTKSDSTTAQYPAAGSIVEVTATDDASVTMNLPETTVFEKLTFKGEGSVTLIKNNDRPLSAAELEVKTDVTVPYALAGFTGTRVSVDESKVLRFDFSSYDYSSVTTTTTIPVTGIVAARGDDSTYDARFGVVSGSLPVHIASVTIGYNSTTYSYEVTITPDHEAGATVYYETGYITAVMDGSSNVGTVYLDAQKQNQTHLFPGDTMVFGESPASSVFISDTFNGNLEIPSSVTVDLRKGNVSNAVMDGRTITVNGTLTLSQYGAQVHNFGSVTVNGTGTVRFDADVTVNQLTGTARITISEGKTLTLTTVASWTEFVSGGVSGTGTIKLPAYTGGGEVNLNKFGTEGSTIELTGMNGWITMADTNIRPTIRLTGDMTISGVSNKTYTFAKITGEGDITFPNQNSPVYVITEVEGYTGSIVNNHESVTLTINSVKLGSNPRNAIETLVVATTTPSRITVQNVYYNNELVNLSGSLSRENKVDGIYIVRAGTIFSVY